MGAGRLGYMLPGEPPIGSSVQRAWKIGVGRQVSGSSTGVRQRQQAGALQTPREWGGALRSCGGAWTTAACRRRVRRAGGASRLSTGSDDHGLKQGRLGLALQEGRCVRGNGDLAGWLICGSSGSGRTIGVRNGGRKGRAVGRWMPAAGRMRVSSSGLASFGLRLGRSSDGSGHLRTQPAAAPAVPVRQGGPKCEMR